MYALPPPLLLYISSPHDTVYCKLPFSHTLVLDQVPTANQLHLVQQIGDPPTSSSYPMPSCSTTVPTLPPFEKTSTPLYIGGGMPPIPAKLAKRIIITSHQRFPDFNWATYDREFRQQAAARTIPDWSVLDNTLWNLARQSTAHSSTTQFTRQPYKFQQTEKTYRSQLPPQ